MKTLFLAVAAAAMVTLAPAPTQASETLSPEATQELSRLNTLSQPLIAGLTDVIIAEELNALLEAMSDDPASVEELRPQARLKLAQARTKLARLSRQLSNADLSVSSDLDDQRALKTVANVGPFVRDLRERADGALRLYERQLTALEAGDEGAYDALILEEADTTVLMLQAENQFIALNTAIQDKALPIFYHMTATQDANDVVIAMLQLFSQYQTSTEEEDRARADEAADAMKAYRRNLSMAEKKTRTFCKQKPTGQQRAAFNKACGLLQQIDEVNRAIEEPLAEYVAVVDAFASGEATDEVISRLTVAEEVLSPLVDQRFVLFNQRAAAFLELIEASN
ncbi:MAG: hypothetical protein AAGH41_02445 [Pseudomonadota bacterium]